ncbi:unnamed protein product [Durusdinium trenchii]|uniref:Uncharacterized protein n=1 Tax=Durusdinium trenchii TaxID=1381693 RepID=A0ABP0Q0T6_9DINO
MVASEQLFSWSRLDSGKKADFTPLDLNPKSFCFLCHERSRRRQLSLELPSTKKTGPWGDGVILEFMSPVHCSWSSICLSNIHIQKYVSGLRRCASKLVASQEPLPSFIILYH